MWFDLSLPIWHDLRRGSAPRPAREAHGDRVAVRPLIVDGLIVLAAVLGWRALRQLERALRHSGEEDSSIWLIRGIRALIAAAASAAFALGVVYESRATIIIAAVILGEELYETGVVLLILRRRP